MNENLKHEVEFIIKSKESLAENEIKHGSHKFVLILSQRLDLRGSDKQVACQNVFICYTQKNMRKQYQHNKLKIIAPILNDELDAGFYFASDIKIKLYFSLKSTKH